MSVISFILDADHRDKLTLLLSAAENNTVVYLIRKFIGVHVGLMPKVFRDTPPIEFRPIIDNFMNGFKIGLRTTSDHINLRTST